MAEKKLVIAGIAIIAILIASVLGYNYYQQQLIVTQQQDAAHSVLYFGTVLDLRWLAATDISNLPEALIGMQIYEGLTGYDPNTGAIIPVLADSLPKISSDGLTYTFHLRQGITFHDGTPLNAQAVYDTYLRARDDPNSLAPALFYGVININATKVLDPSTIEFHMTRSFSAVPAFFASNYFGVSSSAHFNLQKDEYVGTGPWKFDHWTRGVEIVLTRNDNYWNKQAIPKLKTLVFKFYKDVSTMVLDLKQHVLDIAWPTFTPTDIQTFQTDSRFTATPQPSGENIQIVMTWKVKPLDDMRVRQAIAYSMDRNEIISRVYNNITAKAQLSLAPDMFPGYVPAFNKYPFDPAKAKQLLADAGYPNGFDTSITYGTNRQGDDALAVVVQSQLAKAGIRAKIIPLDPAGYSRAFRSGQFELLFGHFIYDYFDGAQYLINYMGGANQGGNWAGYTGYNNPQVQTLISQFMQANDPTQRSQLYAQLQQAGADTIPFVPLGTRLQYEIHWKTVQGFKVSTPYWATTFSSVTKTG